VAKHFKVFEGASAHGWRYKFGYFYGGDVFFFYFEEVVFYCEVKP